MKCSVINTTLSLLKRLASVFAILLLPMTASGQELGEPFIGPEILSDTVQIEYNGSAACVLRSSGDVFCWQTFLPLYEDFENLFADQAGFSELNVALDSDIAQISLDFIHLCGIGRVSGVACVDSDRPTLIAYAEVQNPPEPDAQYRSVSNLRKSNVVVCAIQADYRVVCWGGRGVNTIPVLDVPPEAAYLKQLDVQSFRACGIDLTDRVVCWGRPAFLANGDDSLFGSVDIASIRLARQVSLGEQGACIIDTNDKLECFGRLSSYTEIFSEQSFSNIELSSNTFMCFETTSGDKDCVELNSADSGTTTESLVAPDSNVRLYARSTVCYVTTDEDMRCRVASDRQHQSLFPTAPENLSVDLYSDTQGELTWARASLDHFASDYATGYEIFRDGVLIDRLPVVTSYFDADTNPTARYEVRAIRGLIAGKSSFVNADGSDVSIGSPPVDTPEVSPGTVEPPANIRLDGNLLRWDEVAGVSKYNIYRLSSARPNPNGTYLATVVGANEFALSTVGIYTVVSASSDGYYSALDRGGLVQYNTGTFVNSPANIRLDGNVLRWDEVAGVSKYNIYRLDGAGPNRSGIYQATVVDANEFALSTAGIYTVVSTSRDGSSSTLDASGRVDFDF